MVRFELDGVTPFNEVYYIDCLWLAFFTSVRYLNGSVYSFMANNYFLYELVEQESKGLSLKIGNRSVKQLHEICEYNNIGIEAKNSYCQDIVDYIKDSLLSGGIIFLPVDGFYYKHPYHDLFYLKQHHYNAMCIYGFDSERQVFKTTETNGFQWNNENCHYKHEISFKDLVLGHEGFINYLQRNPAEHSILKLYKNSSEKTINTDPGFYKSTMFNNLNAHKNDIIKGLQNIRMLTENMGKFCMSETAAFNNMVASASNHYAIKNILGESGTYIQTLEDIVDTWRMIRNVLYKYEFKGVQYDVNIFQPRLCKLYELENLLYEDLFSRGGAI
jgi:hypothetical protein